MSEPTMSEQQDWIATLLGALAAPPVAWREPSELARSLGWDEDTTLDRLAALDVDGWLETSEREGGPAVFLSGLGAERMGLKLVEVGLRMTLRWARAGEPDPPAPPARNVCSAERAAAMEFIIDPEPPPDIQAEQAEAARIEARARSLDEPGQAERRRPELPRPTLLLGQGLTPWPGPARASRPPCPACGGAPLQEHVYCICCDRWGLDALLAPRRTPAPIRRDATSPRPKRPESPMRQAGDVDAARARRKQRRRRKLEALKAGAGQNRPHSRPKVCRPGVEV